VDWGPGWVWGGSQRAECEPGNLLTSRLARMRFTWRNRRGITGNSLSACASRRRTLTPPEVAFGPPAPGYLGADLDARGHKVRWEPRRRRDHRRFGSRTAALTFDAQPLPL